MIEISNMLMIPFVTPFMMPFKSNFLNAMRFKKHDNVPEIEPKQDISEGGMITAETEAKAKVENETEESEAEVAPEVESEDNSEVESEDTSEEEPEATESEVTDAPELSEEEAKEEDKFQEALENPTEESNTEEEPEEEISTKKTIVLPPQPGQELNEPMVLEQFECKDCDKKYYIREDDNTNNSSEILCPFCEMNAHRIRKFDMIIQKYEDLK